LSFACLLPFCLATFCWIELLLSPFNHRGRLPWYLWKSEKPLGRKEIGEEWYGGYYYCGRDDGCEDAPAALYGYELA
jgi:hypothetical protein